MKLIPFTECTPEIHDLPPLPLEQAITHICRAVKSEYATAPMFTDDKMNKAIESKISVYYDKQLRSYHHYGKVMIPRMLAQVIHSQPDLIGPAIHRLHTEISEGYVRPLPNINANFL